MSFTYTLEQEDGSPADPPMLQSALPKWRPGDTLPLGVRTPCVVDVRAGEPPVLVVGEETAELGCPV
jgi:hypothetical protein